MKKPIFSLFISTLLLTIIFFIYYHRYTQNKNLLIPNLPFIPENTIFVYYTNDFDKTWREFSKTTVYKCTYTNNSLLQLVDSIKRLIPNLLKTNDTHANTPIFISLHLNEAKNQLEYIFYLPKYISLPTDLLDEKIHKKNTTSNGKILSIKTKSSLKEKTLHYIETSNYIVVSQYEATLNSYLDLKSAKGDNKFIKEIDPKRSSLIINSKNLKSFIDILFSDEYLDTNFSSTISSLSEQVLLDFRVTNKCVSLNGFITTKNLIVSSRAGLNNEYKKSNLKQYCTTNTITLKLLNIDSLESFLDEKSKSDYNALTHEDKMFIASISSQIKGEVASCKLNTIDDTNQHTSILFIDTHNARLFTDILFANNYISIQESPKNSLPIYTLNNSIFNNYILGCLSPATIRYQYMTIVDNCIVLSKNSNTISSWYELYIRQKLWEATNYLTRDNADILYLVAIQKYLDILIPHINSEWQDIANKFVSNIDNISFYINRKGDDLYKVSLVIRYGNLK
jgi:hypothetical protein